MVHYVAYYNPKNEAKRRVANYAGEDKIDYICDTINRIGEDVTILSNTKSTIKKFLKRTEYKVSKKKKIVMFSSLPSTNRLMHAIDVLYGYIQLTTYLIKNVKKNDVVLVYHSLGYRNLFKYLKKIKKFKYILEVEELFKYIKEANSFKERENIVFKYSDAFIFSNSILEKKINKQSKPSVVVNGVYKNEKRIVEKIKNGKKIVVYAGSFEEQKGVDYIIKSAQYLDEKYEVRIIGFGSKADINRIMKLIEVVSKKTKCQITYEGVFKGDDYLRYIQKCDIGVCIQNPDDEFNKYEFPSKILSYMSNGLNVVINKLEQIENSRISKYVTFVDGTEPQKIALSIKKTSNNKYNSKKILEILDNDFEKELKKIIKGE